jgi:hypothetical protein
MFHKIAVMSIAFVCLAPTTALVFAAGVSSAEGVYDAVVKENEGSTPYVADGWCAGPRRGIDYRCRAATQSR